MPQEPRDLVSSCTSATDLPGDWRNYLLSLCLGFSSVKDVLTNNLKTALAVNPLLF